MALIVLGALLMIVGVVLAADKSASRGRMSKPPESEGEPHDTLEPGGRGKQLSIKADLPGIALFVVGGILVFAGAASYG
jgi:hypothetical protein